MPLLLLISALSAALSGEIAYIDLSAGTSGAVCVVEVSNGAVRQVGPGQQDGAPQWSPDGKWLTFETNTDGGRGIYVVDASGENGRLVGDSAAWNTSPTWSTDGRRLAYCSATERGALAQLRVHDLNTGEETVWAGGRPGMLRPRWMPYSKLMFSLSPDRELVVPGVDLPRFLDETRMKLLQLVGRELPEALLAIGLSSAERESGRAIETELVLVSKSEVLPLLAVVEPERAERDAVLWNVAPNWSDYEFEAAAESGITYGGHGLDDPGEMSRIAFESNEGGDREIYVLGRRGVANVSNHRAADWNPVWSPDGKTLAIESFRSGRRGIYRIYADTAHVEPMAVSDSADCWSAAWSPDGEHIVYASDATGRAELYIAAARDGEASQLTDGDGSKEAPVWRPEGP